MKKVILLSLFLVFTQLDATNVQRIDNHREYKNVYTQYNMGLRFKHATPTRINQQNAFKYLHKSALKGHVLAQYELALMFHYGKGVRQNAELARLWFTRAAKKGHTKAQDILYRFYSAKKPRYNQLSGARYSQIFRTYR